MGESSASALGRWKLGRSQCRVNWPRGYGEVIRRHDTTTSLFQGTLLKFWQAFQDSLVQRVSRGRKHGICSLAWLCVLSTLSNFTLEDTKAKEKQTNKKRFSRIRKLPVQNTESTTLAARTKVTPPSSSRTKSPWRHKFLTGCASAYIILHTSQKVCGCFVESIWPSKKLKSLTSHRYSDEISARNSNNEPYDDQI